MKNNSSFPVPHYAVLRRRQHQVTSISWLLKHIPAGSCLFTSPQHSGCQSFFWQSQLSAIEPHSHLQPHFSLIPLWWDNILANKVACCCSPYLPHPLYSCQSDLYFKVPGNLQWILFFFLPTPCSRCDLSSPNRDWTHVSCIGSMETQPLDHQASPFSEENYLEIHYARTSTRVLHRYHFLYDLWALYMDCSTRLQAL